MPKSAPKSLVKKSALSSSARTAFRNCPAARVRLRKNSIYSGASAVSETELAKTILKAYFNSGLKAAYERLPDIVREPFFPLPQLGG